MQMFWYKDIILSQKFNSIPTDVYDLESLQRTLKYLYRRKKYLLELAAKDIKFLYCSKKKYSLINTCEKDGSQHPKQYYLPQTAR